VTFNNLPLNDAKNYGVLLLANNDPNSLYSSFSAANPGGTTQMLALSNADGQGITFAIEDQPGITGPSDYDYNDLIVRFHPVDLNV